MSHMLIDLRGPTRSRLRTVLITVAMVGGGLAASGLVNAEEKELPPGEAVLDKYVETVGGKDAFTKFKSRVTKGSLEFVGQGLKGATTEYVARPAKQYFAWETESMGTFEAGTNGDVVWEVNMMQGPRIKKGGERILALREARLDTAANWRDHYRDAKCVGIEDVAEKPAYKVILTPREGPAETNYYDKESGLLVKSELELETAMGTLPLVAHISDYKRVDGVLLPHKVEQTVAGIQHIRMITESIAHNVEIPPERFELPEEIQKLVEKEKAEASATDKEG